MILVDNSFVNRKDFGVDMEDRAYQFGDGVYEVIRVYGGSLFAMDRHLDRLWRSAGEISITLPFKKEELAGQLVELVKINGVNNGAVYLQVSRGAAPRVHHFPPDAKPLLVAYTKNVERPLKQIKEGVKAVTFEDIRWLRCDIKSLNLLGNVLAKQSAVEKGAVEAILHRGGVVTEGSSTNIFMVKGGTIHTHPENNLILSGVTRGIVVRLAKQLNITLLEEPFTVEEVYQAGEIFATSTTYEVLPITAVDGRTIGSGRPGPVTRMLQEAFEKAIP